MKKRILCLMLLLCMLFPAIVSCAKDESGEDGSDGNGNGIVADNPLGEYGDKYNVTDDLGDVDLGGRTISIASCGRTDWLGEVSVENFNGEAVNDAVYKRNLLVQERLNITIDNIIVGTGQFDIPTELGKHIQAGTHMYDIIMNPAYATIIYTGSGYLHDLSKSESLNLSKPYWNQEYNGYASVGNGHQFIATGAVSLMLYRSTYVTVVNEKVLKAAPNAPDLFEVVNDGKWTLEYQKILASRYYDDANGNSISDEGDNFGFLTTPYNGVDGYFASCELTIMNKNADNYFSLALDIERMSNVMDLIIDIFSQDYTWCTPHDGKHETKNGEWPTLAKKFAEGNSLMMTNKFQLIEGAEIQGMKDEYSILPIPKYSEDQEKYYSFAQASHTAMAIPATSPEDDIDTFGIVMEAMASESYRTVIPVYYEKVLKGRYAKNPETVEMLDMIFTNMKIDCGHLYNNSLAGGIVQKYRDVAQAAVENGAGNMVSSTFNANLMAQVSQDIKKLENNIRIVVGEAVEE